MINKNFFPTPINVIQKMVPNLKKYRYILEPSAGKGDIADYISKVYEKKVYCIEIEPELRSILQDKGHIVIDQDFLNFRCERKYDIIIMNPPFDTGDKHLIKAMEIGPYSEIVCLLNVETIDNPCTKTRALLQSMLLERDAEYEYLGQAFKNAERRTDVEVVLVRIKGKPDNQFHFKYKSDDTEKLYGVEDLVNHGAVETSNVYASIVNRYNKSREIAAEIKAKMSELQYYASGILTDHSLNILPSITTESYEDFTDILRSGVWDYIFTQTQITNYVTSEVRDSLVKQNDSQKALAITEKNIYGLRSALVQNLGKIREQCIEQAFDLLTKYYKENRVHIEGWKTNSAWHVSKKCILPSAVDTRWSNPSFYYEMQRRITDIEKALCLISDVQYSSIEKQCLSGRSTYDVGPRGEWQDSYFFRWKWFHKQTMHLEFKDAELLKRFNFFACKSKNWLHGGFE